jgi:hypothetical protein
MKFCKDRKHIGHVNEWIGRRGREGRKWGGRGGERGLGRDERWGWDEGEIEILV